MESKKKIAKEDLKSLDFSGLDLSGRTFEDCDLDEAKFFQANLDGAIFLRCSLGKTIFNQCIGYPSLIQCAKNGALIEKYAFMNYCDKWAAVFRCTKLNRQIYYFSYAGVAERELTTQPRQIERNLYQLLNEC